MFWRCLLLLAAVAGCSQGVIGEPSSNPPTDPTGEDPNTPPPVDDPTPEACEEATPVVPQPLMRLGRIDYIQSLRAVVGSAAVDRVEIELQAVPEDHGAEEGLFARTDQRLSSQHIDAYYRVANALAAEVASDEALRAAVAGACAQDGGGDDACLRAFATELLQAAFRRVPSTADVDQAVAAATDFSGTDRIHAILFTTLMAPDFLFRFENRGAVDNGVTTLTGFELAARLSYHFWQAPPDPALMAAAAAGELETEEGYRAQVDRMYADPRTEATIIGFFESWLRVDRGPFADNSPRLAIFRGTLDTDGLAAEMHEEVRDLLRYHLAADDGWDEVLTSPYSFARTARLAGIYGVGPWDGTATPPLLPASERAGLLTRAGMLYTADGSTNPFKRGVALRRALLCDTVSPPPDDLPADSLQPPPTAAGASTREQFANKVVNQPCAGCHAQFSPLGYALESFDGLGRYREREHLVSATGEDFGFVDVDARTVPRVDYTDDREVDGGAELSGVIAASEKANACLAEQYFQFTYRREAGDADRCIIHNLASRLDDGLPLREALKSIALDSSFRTRLEMP